jgi:C-terminal peptidase prc
MTVRRVFLAPLLGCFLLPLLWLSGCVPGFSVALRSPTVPPTLTPTPEPTHAYKVALPPLDRQPTPTLRQPTPTASPLPTFTPTPTPTATSAHSRQAIFEKVWRTIDEQYLYADFRGLDWDAVWTEFAPRVVAAESDDAFYALLTEMVGRLNDNHSRFLAPHDAVAENVITVGLETRVGIGVITAPTFDGAIIQHVFSDSPAARAELRPRDRIIAVDGAPFVAGRDITGREGTTVRLTVVRPDDTTREVVLTRQRVEGRISPLAQRLEGDIGYIRITTLWVNDMADQVSGALTDLVVERPLNGLILDLRGNPGGWREVLTNVLGHFVQGNVGMFYDRHSVRTLTIRGSSGPDLRGLPLVVLIDGNTASYAEVLAAILQAEADAYVIGMPSSGNTETIYAYELPDGARLWVAQEGFRLRNGTNLEGHGVQPDLIIDVEWARYSQTNDPHIREALHHLHSR